MAIASRTSVEAVKVSFSRLKTDFTSLKKAQEEASIALMEESDVFVRLLTGFGVAIITVLLTIDGIRHMALFSAFPLYLL